MVKQKEKELINNFKDKYAFLSNFYPCSIVREGQCYPSVEHAFQAAKTLNPVAAQQIQFAKNPVDAKAMGRKVELRKDWEEIKLQVMVELIYDKFNTHKDLKQQLIKTGDVELIKGNYWHDNIWGVCECLKCGNKGENLLGKILMMERDMLKQTGEHIYFECDGELAFCIVCGGGEGTLTTNCCGRRITKEEEERIYVIGDLDFRDGQWVNPNYPRISLPIKEHKLFNTPEGEIQCEFCNGIYGKNLLPECYKRTTVVHCKKEPYDILIDRTTKWGNHHFIVGRDGTQEDCVKKHMLWLMNQPELLAVMEKELKGKRLGCHCKPKYWCHGDNFIFLIEGDENHNILNVEEYPW